MRRLSLFLGLGALVALLLVVVPAFAAGGGSTTCNGTLAPGTYQRVVVPQDGVCLSDGPVTIRAGLFVQQGGTLVMMTFTFAREVVQMAAREGITGLAGVPTFWSLLAQPQSTLHNTPLPQLRYITNTGGAMPQPVLTTLRKALPNTKVFLMYGLTEAFRSTYLPPEELDRR